MVEYIHGFNQIKFLEIFLKKTPYYKSQTMKHVRTLWINTVKLTQNDTRRKLKASECKLTCKLFLIAT